MFKKAMSVSYDVRNKPTYSAIHSANKERMKLLALQNKLNTDYAEANEIDYNNKKVNVVPVAPTQLRDDEFLQDITNQRQVLRTHLLSVLPTQQVTKFIGMTWAEPKFTLLMNEYWKDIERDLSPYVKKGVVDAVFLKNWLDRWFLSFKRAKDLKVIYEMPDRELTNREIEAYTMGINPPKTWSEDTIKRAVREIVAHNYLQTISPRDDEQLRRFYVEHGIIPNTGSLSAEDWKKIYSFEINRFTGQAVLGVPMAKLVGPLQAKTLAASQFPTTSPGFEDIELATPQSTSYRQYQLGDQTQPSDGPPPTAPAAAAVKKKTKDKPPKDDLHRREEDASADGRPDPDGDGATGRIERAQQLDEFIRISGLFGETSGQLLDIYSGARERRRVRTGGPRSRWIDVIDSLRRGEPIGPYPYDDYNVGETRVANPYFDNETELNELRLADMNERQARNQMSQRQQSNPLLQLWTDQQIVRQQPQLQPLQPQQRPSSLLRSLTERQMGRQQPQLQILNEPEPKSEDEDEPRRPARRRRRRRRNRNIDVGQPDPIQEALETQGVVTLPDGIRLVRVNRRFTYLDENNRRVRGPGNPSDRRTYERDWRRRNRNL